MMKTDNLIIGIVLSSVIGGFWHMLWVLWSRKWEAKGDIASIYWSLRAVELLYGICLIGSIVMSCSFWVSAGSLWKMRTPVLGGLLLFLTLAWAVGGVVCLGKYLTLQMTHFQRIRNRMPCDQRENQIARQIAGQMGIRSNVIIRKVITVTSPELVGWLRPCIVIPDDTYDDEQLANIVTHELVHLRYGDRWFRELGVILGCVYWFNPLTERLIRHLEIWDEYHCDAMVCARPWIEPMSYVNSLVDMSEKMLGWTRMVDHNETVSGFCEKSEYLFERVRKIMRSAKRNKNGKKLWKALLVSGIIMLAGSGSAFAAGQGVNELWQMAAINTYEEVTENAQEAETDSEKEYTIVPDEELLANVIWSQNPITRGFTLFSGTVKSDKIWMSGSIKADSGQSIRVTVTAEPEDARIKVGLQEPDAIWRFVYCSGGVDHTFSLSKTGTYYVMIWNISDVSVDFGGSYIVKDN